MEITGPLTIGIAEKLEGNGMELHIGFTEAFRKLGLAEQGAAFRAYLADLGDEIEGLSAADANRAGMLLIQQVAEQLLPHVEAGDLSLGDTIVVDVGGGLPVSLTDLL